MWTCSFRRTAGTRIADVRDIACIVPIVEYMETREGILIGLDDGVADNDTTITEKARGGIRGARRQTVQTKNGD